MPDIRSLETFYWVAQLRSFKGAAERMATTQPAVSLRIAALEDELGVKLLDRGPRLATPTARGRLLFEYAERFLHLRADMWRAVAAPQAIGGVVRLGVSETIVHTWLATFIERVHALYPQVTLEIEVDVSPNLRDGLVDHRLDLAFLIGPISVPTIVNRPLCVYPLACVASSALDLGKRPLELSDLAARPIITYPRTTRPYIEFLRLFQGPDIQKPRIYSSSSLSTIVRMALDGIGISVIPPITIPQEIRDGRLRVVPVEVEMPSLSYTVAYASSADTVLHQALTDLTCTIARQDDEARGNCASISADYGAQSKKTISQID